MKTDRSIIEIKFLKKVLVVMIMFLIVTDTVSIYKAIGANPISFNQEILNFHDSNDLEIDPELSIESWMLDENYLINNIKSKKSYFPKKKLREFKIDEGVQFERIIGF